MVDTQNTGKLDLYINLTLFNFQAPLSPAAPQGIPLDEHDPG